MKTADISWKRNKTPYSKQFNDIYYDTEDGLFESSHVFIKGANIDKKWSKKNAFFIGEIGFGTGLNFLNTWRTWLESKNKPSKIFYIAIEGYPIKKSDFKNCLHNFPILKTLQHKLIESYPKPEEGIHKLFFENGSVVLTLLYGSVLPMLKTMDKKVDAWFLDGFSPEKNKDMWESEVINEIQKLSKFGTSIATYSVASLIRRRLEQAKFKIMKRKGTKHKKFVLNGTFIGTPSQSNLMPWFKLTNSIYKDKPSAVIVGGGIAGTNLAYALKKRSINITLIDQSDSIANLASSSPRAILEPRIIASNSLENKFFGLAWSNAIKLINEIEQKGFNLSKENSASLHVAFNSILSRKYNNLISSKIYPNKFASLVNCVEASKLSGFDIRHNCLHIPDSITLSPKEFCEALVYGIRRIMNTKVKKLIRKNNTWELRNELDETIITADMVFIAMGINSLQIGQTKNLPINAKAGQVTALKSNKTSQMLKTIVSGGCYITPSYKGLHHIGATYDNLYYDADEELNLKVNSEADNKNINNANRILPSLLDCLDKHKPKSWSGIRCTTVDHLPIAGPLPNENKYLSNYKDIKHGRKYVLYPDANYHPGLFILTGLGSRGLLTAPLLSETIVSIAMGENLSIPYEFIPLFHPGRFIIRNLKKQ